MPSTTYRVVRVGDGWRATADHEERIFTDRDEAIRWCHHHAVNDDVTAAPEEGAYAEVDIEIVDG